MDKTVVASGKPPLDASHIEDLKHAASKMRFVERRSFEAAMALKYCGGSARQAEEVFGWSLATRLNWDFMSDAAGSSAWERRKPSVETSCGKKDILMWRKRCGHGCNRSLSRIRVSAARFRTRD